VEKRITLRKVSRAHEAVLALQDSVEYAKDVAVQRLIDRMLRDVDEAYTLAKDYPR
jgi:hypothetical protein